MAFLQSNTAVMCRSVQKHEIREVVIPELTILYLNDTVSHKDMIVCSVQIGVSDAPSYNIKIIVDTGSSVSILPEGQYFADFPLTRSNVRLKRCLAARVLYNGITASATIYIKSGSPLLGMDLI